MKRCVISIGAAIISIGLSAGCAPTASLKSAQDAYETAKAAGAKDKAPYEYYAAKAYLELAGVVNQERDYQEARTFAEKSQALSKQAFEKAGGGVK